MAPVRTMRATPTGPTGKPMAGHPQPKGRIHTVRSLPVQCPHPLFRVIQPCRPHVRNHPADQRRTRLARQQPRQTRPVVRRPLPASGVSVRRRRIQRLDPGDRPPHRTTARGAFRKKAGHLLAAVAQGSRKGRCAHRSRASPARPIEKNTRSLTAPYMTIPAMVITTKSRPEVAGLEDFRGLRVAAVAGYVTERYLLERYQGVFDIVPRALGAGWAAQGFLRSGGRHAGKPGRGGVLHRQGNPA